MSNLADTRPNVLFLMCDQLTSAALNIYGGDYIETPNIDKLASEGVVFDNMISTCPVCTPYRSMWLTGRYPQSTGHVINFVQTRHDEIGWGDVFENGGYDTAYIGKWHLHKGSFPAIDGPDFVPEGRDRLGFRHWRGYNFHTDYFDGTVNLDDWHFQKWQGYETDALNQLAFEYLDEYRIADKPFCMMLNPHQPHFTEGVYAPDWCYKKLPDPLVMPPKCPHTWSNLDSVRNYLAMVVALDAMVGELMGGLKDRGLDKSTVIVFTTDHGTHFGRVEESGMLQIWGKKMPWETDVRVPMIMKFDGVFDGGRRVDTLTSAVDLLPSFCSLCGINIPRSVQGYDLSDSWLGKENAFEQDDVYMMNFGREYDFCLDGWEWRGLRTKQHTYAKFLDGKELLFDNIADPMQSENICDSAENQGILQDFRRRLDETMTRHKDELLPGSHYHSWFDDQRRIIRNVDGELSDPEKHPDWTLL